MNSDFTACSTCQVERLASTLDGNGQCPFCVDEGVPPPVPPTPPAPEPKYAQVTVVPSKNAGPRAKSDAPAIPRAARAEDQQAVNEAYTLPYAAPIFDIKKAEADPAKELALRALCRRRLLPFVQRFRPKYLAGWVHEDICRRLERFVRAVEAGESPRLLLLLPPRSGKSELGSRNFPPWVLGQHPDWEIIAASHTQSLTLSFSRYVRDLVRDPAYKAIFPDLMLDPASQSIENWNTLQGGGYMAAGVGTGISGRGCHILVVDDVVKDAEAADSVTIRENTWEWYISTAYTRLAPGGGVLGILCMTGDTPVLMADGTQRRLDSLSVSDEIATYDRGRLSTSTIKGLRSNGRDSVLKITTISGKIVRANERHPFLTVTNTGELRWTRTRNLTTAQRIVTVKGNGVNGKERCASPETATQKWFAEGTASHTTPRSGGPTVIDQPLTVSDHVATPGSSTGTGSLSKTMTLSMRVRAAAAQSAENQQMLETHLVTGSTSSPSTIATTQVRSEACCVTTAMQESDTLELSPWHLPQPGISDFTLDEIVSIEPAGAEEVFDLQVERTENFIANGLVSHNTWWHEDDWAGRIQDVMKSGDGDVFEVVKYPAINEEGDEYILPDDTIQQFAPESDPPPEGSRLTRLRNTAIHPARYTTAMMVKIKMNLISSGLKRVWNALYQQNPVPDDGVYFTKEMMRWYTHPPRRQDMFVYQAWDFAITEKTDSDWTVCCTLGQDEADNLYVLHILRFRSGDGNAIVDDILDQYEMFKPDLIGFEDGQIWKSLTSQFKKRCDERKLYPNSELLQPLTDKKVRAGPLKGRMQNGKLFVRQNQPWTEAFRQEFMKFPSGKYDDQCFSAGTLIHLADGTPRPIETLQAGDAVLTPIGARRVLRAGCTSESAVVYDLDGLLVGTGGHPIWVEKKGWVRLDSLTPSDRLQSLLSQECERSSWQNQSASSSTARSTGGILTLLGSIFSGTSRGLAAFCTAISGCISTARSRLGTKFITSTATRSTTTFQTSNACQGRSTASSIQKLDQPSGGRKSSRLIWPEFVKKLLSGTAVLKGLLGTQSTASSPGSGERKSDSFANNVLDPSSRSFQQVDSAQSLVGTSIGTKSIQITKLPRELDAKQPVFNIEVEDAHCYYANGILVHNCDATAWCVRLTLTKSAPKAKAPPPQKSWKDKLRELTSGQGGHMAA